MSLLVTKLPFYECLPSTTDGIRTLALIAVQAGMPALRSFLDELELRILRAMRIKPEGARRDEAWTPIKIIATEHGLVIQWRLGPPEEVCEACGGRGELQAWGKDSVRYDVECPKCDGAGWYDEDLEEFMATDIDGKECAYADGVFEE